MIVKQDVLEMSIMEPKFKAPKKILKWSNNLQALSVRPHHMKNNPKIHSF